MRGQMQVRLCGQREREAIRRGGRGEGERPVRIIWARSIGFVMSGKNAAQKAVRAIDWQLLEKVVVSENGKKELGRLRRAFDEVNATLLRKFSMKPYPIDWNYYKERFTNPALVDLFQKSYESLQIPDFENPYTAQYKKQMAALMVKVGEKEEELRKESAKCKEMIKKLREQKEAIKTMTVDEYFAKNPELKEKIDEEIRNHNWGY